jgi:imidazole glycerol-phosphate synthase subunit HisH
MIGIVDYSMGNLRSVQKALQKLNADARIIDAPDLVDACDKLIVPGVGAFADAMAQLNSRRLVAPIKSFIDSGRPFLGICLGLQLLFDVGEEDGEHPGLGVIPGRVVRFQPADPNLKVPHMGWNALDIVPDDNPLFTGVKSGDHVYFVHSYYAAPADDSVVAARADYGGPFCCSVHRDNLWATQFHPEKSQHVGLKILANFTRT